ncbi:MAG TPA: methyltransferase domain-containing protein [Clostridia bacterium]|nr:methyltransferase domain-containing protein [Clostridia bacterium]
MTQRTLAPEWLDELPADDARAVASRADLQRLNFLMGHVGIMLNTLRSTFLHSPPARVVDFGAGDGTFLLRVAKRLAPQWRDLDVFLVDRQPAVSERVLADFQSLGWRSSVQNMTASDWLRRPDSACDLLLANLFLHHLPDSDLAETMALVARCTTTFLAMEPRRSRTALAFSRLLGVIGCNQVTRHDAPVSVKAGFAGRELSRLWPSSPNWRLHEQPAGLFSHCFLAVRTG